MKTKLSNTQFQQLFNQYYEELCRIVYPILKNTTDAEDIVQDVFVKVWQNRNKTIVNNSYKAYLYKACVFRAIDFIRKQKNKQKASINLQIVKDKHAEAKDNVQEQELKNIIENSLNKLPYRTKEVFLLSRYSNLKNREIAEQLQISIKTVEANIGKALKTLKQDLKPYINNVLITVAWAVEILRLIIG